METYQDYVNNEKNHTKVEAQFGIDGIHDALKMFRCNVKLNSNNTKVTYTMGEEEEGEEEEH